MFDRQNKSIVYFYAIEGSCFFHRNATTIVTLHFAHDKICFAVTGPAERFKSVLGHP